jgi:RNA polymerase sigma-70 factor (ECF subfamily)
LFREHHGAVYRAAYRITGNAMDAEDVLQTVFTRLLRREEQPDLSENAGSYLHRAAVNAALDLMRRRKRARKVDLDEVGDTLVDHQEPGPERTQRPSRVCMGGQMLGCNWSGAMGFKSAGAGPFAVRP